MAVAAGQRPERSGFGIAMILAATFTMAFQDAVVKVVSSDLPLWQLFALRSLIAVPLLIVLHRLLRGSLRLIPRALGWSVLRGAFLVLMYVAFYAALPALNLSLVAAAYYTGPLFIVLFAAALLGEGIGSRRLFAVAFGFLGVLVILQPGTDGFSWAMLIPIASAIFYAGAAILTRSKCAEESPLALSLMLNYCFVACGFGVSAVLWLLPPDAQQQVAYPFLLGPWVALDMGTGGVLLLLAVANVAIHVALARAYQSAPPAVIATFDYGYLAFAAGWAYVLLHEVPGPATLIGMAMIATAGILTAWRGSARSAPMTRK
jgi:drug/metabolite transporter (DMT)-like permease